MFDNLVESSSHKDDIARKGSFIGVTALIYGVLMLAFFVAAAKRIRRSILIFLRK